MTLLKNAKIHKSKRADKGSASTKSLEIELKKKQQKKCQAIVGHVLALSGLPLLTEQVLNASESIGADRAAVWINDNR